MFACERRMTTYVGFKISTKMTLLATGIACFCFVLFVCLFVWGWKKPVKHWHEWSPCSCLSAVTPRFTIVQLCNCGLCSINVVEWCMCTCATAERCWPCAVADLILMIAECVIFKALRDGKCPGWNTLPSTACPQEGGAWAKMKSARSKVISHGQWIMHTPHTWTWSVIIAAILGVYGFLFVFCLFVCLSIWLGE
jgi:hypothetical protein